MNLAAFLLSKTRHAKRLNAGDMMSDTVEKQDALIEAVEGKDKATGDATHDNAEDKPVFTQKQLEAQIAERLTREKRKQDEAVAKAKKDAEQKNLEEQGEHKKLNEQLKAQLAEYEPYKVQLEDANAVLMEVLESFRKEAPEEVLEALSDKSPANQLRFINKYREKWTKATPNGVGSNPAGSTGKGLTSEEQKKRGAGMTRFVRGF